MNTEVIEVRIWNQLVGAVTLDPEYGYYAFGYDDAWRKKGIELAPFAMPTSSTEVAFEFRSLPEATFHRLPALLADALPDAFGNALIDAWMARKGMSKGAVTMLDRLAYMGRRGMGALEFKPALGNVKDKNSPLQMKSLVEQARRLIEGDLSIEDQAEAALTNIIQVGTSAGGARAKAVIAWNPETDQIRSGQFEVPPGFQHWLLKFDGVGRDLALGTGQDYGRIEYAYHRMAIAAGLQMAPCRLLEEHGRAHFMTRRFDREDGEGKAVRHHLQTLCALDHLDYKQLGTHDYSQLFSAAKRLGLSDDAIDQLFLRMAFNVMARNCDDHTKNFTFLLKQGEPWELAPAYDVTHSYSPTSYWTNKHCMSVNGRFQRIRREDLLVTAERFGVRRPQQLLTDVRAATESWNTFADEAGLSTKMADEVSTDFELV
jgi:serine/threonine-protein kinase HipA